MRLIADIYDRPSVDFRNKADLATLASGRFAPGAVVHPIPIGTKSSARVHMN